LQKEKKETPIFLPKQILQPNLLNSSDLQTKICNRPTPKKKKKKKTLYKKKKYNKIKTIFENKFFKKK